MEPNAKLEPNEALIDALLRSDNLTKFTPGQTVYYDVLDVAAFIDKMFETEALKEGPKGSEAYNNEIVELEKRYGKRDSFQAASEAMMAVVEQVLASWAQFIDLTFERYDVAVHSGVDKAHIQFGFADLLAAENKTSGTTGMGGYCASGNLDGVKVIVINENLAAHPASYGLFATLLHEVGHALGLAHPSESYAEGASSGLVEDNEYDTAMSYLASRNPVYEQQYEVDGYGSVLAGMVSIYYSRTPQRYDILAAQRLYGANTDTGSGDTVYTFRANEIDYFMIYDHDGVDTINASALEKDVRINLQPGAASTIGPTGVNNIVIAFNTYIENAFGGSGDDFIIGNEKDNHLKGNGGIDTLHGGAGNDTLDGGADRDYLYGGDDFDTYMADEQDVIFDADGNGEVYLNGVKLTGGAKDPKKPSADLWYGDGFIYRLSGTTLYVGAAGSKGQLTIENFNKDDEDGYLSIKLENSEEEEEEEEITYAYGTVIIGDCTPLDCDPEKEGIQEEYNELGNVITDPNDPDPGRSDTLYGSTDNDHLQGYDGNDYLDAWQGGNDLLEGGAGSDVLITGAGNDKLYADEQLSLGEALRRNETRAGSSTLRGDLLSGGGGNDTIVGGDDADLVFGGTGDDILIGGAGNDNLLGDFGADTVWKSWDVTRQVTTVQENGIDVTYYRLSFGSISGHEPEAGGDDTLYGGAGDDWLYGGAGNDTLDGGVGDDVLVGERGDDLLFGGAGNDVLVGDDRGELRYGNDYLDGGDGDDHLSGNGGHDILFGGAGDDTLQGDDDQTPGQYHGDDYLDGGEGDDKLWGDGGHDTLIGGEGDDYLEGDASNLDDEFHGDDYLDGGEGNDTLWGFGGHDTLLGGAGDDSLNGDANGLDEAFHGNDYLDGGEGNDTLWGFGGHDTLIGGEGEDYLDGGEGNDLLLGGADSDNLLGDAGDDTLVGGAGMDYLNGGEGDDLYIVGATEAPAEGSVYEAIEDESGNDTVRLGVSASAVTLTSIGSDMLITWSEATQGLYIYNGMNGAIENFEFADASLSWVGLVEFYLNNWNNSGNDTLVGSDRNDFVSGGAGSDSLWGLGGNDTLVGGAGTDYLNGGAGDDVYIVGATEAPAMGSTYETITDESGNDTLQLGVAVSAVTLTSIGSDLLMTWDEAAQGLYIQNGMNGVIENFVFADASLSWAGLIDFYLNSQNNTDTETHYAGAGNDTLTGSGSNNVYVVGPETTNVVINNYNADGGLSTLQFEGIVSTQLSGLNISGNNLVIVYGQNNQLVTLKNYFAPGSYSYNRITTVAFADGVTFNQAQLHALYDSLHDYTGSTAFFDGLVQGTAHDQLLEGGAGGELIRGYDYNAAKARPEGGNSGSHDTLVGGQGNDTLVGGYGSNTYVFRVGDGKDVINNDCSDHYNTGNGRFGGTILFADLLPTQLTGMYAQGNDLVITYGTSDQITILNQLNEDNYRGLRNMAGPSFSGYEVYWVEFADGSAFLLRELTALYPIPLTDGDDYLDMRTTWSAYNGMTVSGGAGNDTLYAPRDGCTLLGGKGDDRLYSGSWGGGTLDGGAGNDTMTGSAGTDIYVLRIGSGQDVITLGSTTYNRVDTVVFEDVASNELTNISVTENSVILSYGESDRVRISWRASLLFSFSDGVALEASELLTAYGTINVIGNASPGFSGVTAIGDEGNNNFTVYSNSTAYGGGGNDYLYASGSGISLYGGEGNDTLSGSDSNVEGVLFDGGAGNDEIYGRGGNNIYLLRFGSGHDVIYNFNYDQSGGPDILRFEDVASTGVSAIYQSGVDLVIAYGLGDQVTLLNHFNTNPEQHYRDYRIDRIEFADGVVWSRQTLEAMFAFQLTDGNDRFTAPEAGMSVDGGAGDDTLTACAGGNTLLGGAGNDSLIGAAGNDILDGGTGNDTLAGGAGSDTYVFRLGSGQDLLIKNDTTSTPDTVVFEDVASTGLTGVAKSGNDLIITYGESDQLTLQNHFNGTAARYRIDWFEFADGVQLGADDLMARYPLQLTSGNDTMTAAGAGLSMDGGAGNDRLTAVAGGNTLYGGTGNDTLIGAAGNDMLYGGEGNDSLTGNAGDDILDGGTGNDTLTGGAGNDTYVFRLGSGQDVINNTDTVASAIDTVVFEDIASTELTGVIKSGNDLILKYGESDQITLQNHFYGTATTYRIDRFEFADGITLSADELQVRHPLQLTSGADTYTAQAGLIVLGGAGADRLTASATGNALYGEAGNDTLIGAAGSDTLYGGEGNDSLTGNAGDDLLDGGTGNDTLTGGAGNDTYIFRIGSGQDVINNTDTAVGAIDTVVFEDVASTALTGLFKSGNDLILKYGESDQITLQNHFYGTATTYRIDRFEFADGITLSADELQVRHPLQLTSGADTYTAQAGLIVLSGAGNDRLTASATGNALYGEVGNDTLIGAAGSDTLYGGEGNDSLTGNAGDDILDGGAGNDTLTGGAGNDTYIFRIGSGQDVVNNTDTVASAIDTVVFEDVASTALTGLFKSGNHLILKYGTADQITLQDHFNANSANYRIDQFVFADGVTLTADELHALYPIQLTTGADTFVVADGGITVLGGAGADRLTASATGNTLYGEAGNDTLIGAAGSDTLYGGEGNDSLTGNAGDDILDGGAGNDTLTGGAGNDTYIFRIGSGQDVVNNNDTVASAIDTVVFEDVASTALTGLFKSGNHLILKYGTADQITLQDHFNANSANYRIDQFVFADGVTLTVDELHALYPVQLTTGADTFVVADGGMTVLGGAGADRLTASATGNTLYGEVGNDTLTGGTGNDVLSGGAGNDSLNGGAGSDTYLFGRGDGADTLNDFDTSGGTDTLSFGEGIAADQLWFRKSGNNLEVSVIGTSDKVTISNWYLGANYQVETFEASDQTLAHTQINALVSAMAAFAVPASGQTTLSDSYREALQPVIAANWQAA